MAGPEVGDLEASQEGNSISATWRDALDSGFYRIQAREVNTDWPDVEWRGTNALSFSGTVGEYVNVSTPPTLGPGSSLTMWIAPNRVGSTGGAVSPGLVAATQSGNFDGYISLRNTSSFGSPEGGVLDIQVVVDDDSGNQTSCDEFTYSVGEPLALAIVVNSDGTVSFYADGELINTPSDTITGLTLAYLGVGYGGVPDEGTFNGIMDEVRHHNEALSAEQVRKHVENEPIYTNGSFYYRFDTGSGTSIVDDYSGGNSGTLSSASWIDHKYDDFAILGQETTQHVLPNKPEGRLYQVRVRSETDVGIGPWSSFVYNYSDAPEITREIAGGLPTYFPNTDESNNYSLLEPVGKYAGNSETDLLLVDEASTVQDARTVEELRELGKLIDTFPREDETMQHYRARLIAEYALSSSAGTIRGLIETAAGIIDVEPENILFSEPAGGENGTAQLGLPGNAVDATGLSQADLIEILDRLVAAGYRLTAQIIGTFTYINPADYAADNHDPTKGYDGLDTNGDPKDNGGTYAGLIT